MDGARPALKPGFDLVCSSLTLQWLADPEAVLAGWRALVRPGGRLVALVWQERERNEWATTVRQSLAAGTPAPDTGDGAPDPFALGNTALAEGILAAAGFTGIGFDDVDEPVYYGPDQDYALEFVLGLREPQAILAQLDADAAEQARGRLAATIAEHDTGHGVYFGSSAWIISARRG